MVYLQVRPSGSDQWVTDLQYPAVQHAGERGSVNNEEAAVLAPVQQLLQSAGCAGSRTPNDLILTTYSKDIGIS